MADQRETVVLVHGLYVHGLWMQLLEFWLAERGYQTVNFSYPSIVRSPADNADALQMALADIEAPTVHFLAHSMGGLVVRHLFHRFPKQRPGRVVTLGTPHQGSHAASMVSKIGLQPLIGRSLEGGLLGDAPPWDTTRALGSIAGTLNVGVSILIPGMPDLGDGMIAVAETKLQGMRDHICLPVSHMQMLVDPTTVDQACAFFATGHFRHSRYTPADTAQAIIPNTKN